MQIDRNELAEELMLREHVRKAIKIVSNRRQKEKQQRLEEELKFRKIIRKLIVETAVDDEEVQETTGMGELRRVLKEIIPIIEREYRKLTTTIEQRLSFRTHIVKGVQNILAPERAMDKESESPVMAMTELDISVTDADGDGFIDVRGTREEEEEELEEPDEGEYEAEDTDDTGRNFATRLLKKIENQVLAGYNSLGDQQDKSDYYDFMLTNLKLHMDDFEDELKADLSPEPTTPEYEKEKAAQEPAGDLGLEPAPEEEILEIEDDDEYFDLGS